MYNRVGWYIKFNFYFQSIFFTPCTSVLLLYFLFKKIFFKVWEVDELKLSLFSFVLKMIINVGP